MRRMILSAISGLLLTAMLAGAQQLSGDWKSVLEDRLKLYGHRNWIVVADSAYPEQSALGVETVVTGADHFVVLQTVMRAIQASKHVRPDVYVDRELAGIAEDDAPGVSGFREQLTAYLNSLDLRTAPVQSLLHEKIIAKLDEVSRTFHVLILKTNMTVPYTSVFLQLDCAYWSPDAERRLRSVMAAQSGH